MQNQKGFFYNNYLESKILNTKALIRLYGPIKKSISQKIQKNKNTAEFSKKLLETKGLFL